MPKVTKQRTLDSDEELYSRGGLSRPPKVARTNALGFGGGASVGQPVHEHVNHFQHRLEENSPESLNQHYTPGPPRARAVTACQTCRGRRTKCDNSRPRCGYCVKVNARCTYLEEESVTACQIYGPRVLAAIEDLRQLVSSQSVHGHQQLEQHTDTAPSVALSPWDTITSPLAQLASFHAQDRDTQLAISNANAPPQSSHTRWRQRPLSSQGLKSVLAWSVFKSDSDTLPETWPEDDDTISNQLLSLPTPTWDMQDMTTLLSRYITGVHIKNPILDLPQIRTAMFLVAENGPDWSCRTCLVALVCAIGALTESYETDAVIQRPYAENGSSYDSSASRVAIGDQDLANRFWNVAAKRIGFAMGQKSLEAVQCLCLTGIWYMHKLQPMIAWKYFSLAGNSWYLNAMNRRRSTSMEDGDEMQRTVRIEQSLFFTIYKSECELRVELDLPESILEDVDMAYAFPSPPKIDNHITETDSHMTERTWYFYLAEIAARHLINHLLRTKSRPRQEPSLREITRLLAEVDLFEGQLRDWHSTLPPSMFFDTSVDIGDYERDELTGILHMRYLTVLELLYRPFVHLCIEQNFHDESDSVRASVVNLATRCLQCCLQKLKIPSPVVHQGSWLGLRTIATATMVLTAAHRSRSNSTLLAATEMVMPQDWQDQIRHTVADMDRFWGESSGGVNKIKQLLDWAMANQ